MMMKTLISDSLRLNQATNAAAAAAAASISANRSGPIANSKKSFYPQINSAKTATTARNKAADQVAAETETPSVYYNNNNNNNNLTTGPMTNSHTQNTNSSSHLAAMAATKSNLTGSSNKLNMNSSGSKKLFNNSSLSSEKPTNSKQQLTSSKINVASALGIKVVHSKMINFKVHIRCTGERFDVSNFPVQIKIRDLKGLLELICGIPFNLQRLSYLDDGEMLDGKELQYYDVIDGAELMMDVWTIYVGLLQASAFGSLDDTLKQGVSTKVEWHSPTSDYMFRQDKNSYIAERGGIALFIASHRGNLELVKGLINYGANVNYESAFGRTPLMISVVANKPDIIDVLLSKNADTEICDLNGDNALTIAKKFNNRLGQHKLAQFKWKKRTDAEAQQKGQQNKEQRLDDTTCFSLDGRLPHQVFDSTQRTWFKGDFMQMYMLQLAPLGEFSGSRFSAPKSIGLEVLKQHRLTRSNTDLRFSAEKDENGEQIITPRNFTFERWLEEKMKEKQKAKQKKLKDELAAQEIEAENAKDENPRDTERLTDNERNLWMKDYLEMKMHRLSKYDLFEMENAGKRTAAAEKSSSQNEATGAATDHSQTTTTTGASTVPKANTKANNNSKQAAVKSNTNSDFINQMLHAKQHSKTSNKKKSLDSSTEIYKGMSYDEWVQIRDEFIRTHNI